MAEPAAGEGEVRRIRARPLHRRVATGVQLVLAAAVVGLAASGGRVVGAFWARRADPEVAAWLAALVGALTLAILSLALLIVLLHDLVKVTLEVSETGLAVDRWVRPFRVRWDEVREIGRTAATGDLTIRTRRGAVTASRRLLGVRESRALEALLARHAGHAIQDWTVWQAVRRQLLVLAGPGVGFALLLGLGQRLLGGGRGRATRR